MTNKIIVFCTCGAAEEAEQIARMLVEEHLASCVNIVTPVKSIYRWKGVVESAEEWLLVIKSTRELFEKLSGALRAAHSYEVPEIVAVPVVAGSDAYLQWMDGELA